MADATSTKSILSVCATTSDKLKNIAIKNGQLIFVRDKSRIALDLGEKRTFYNQIVELTTDEERVSITEPPNGMYYFVIKTAVLWTYQDGWIQVTTPPTEIVFIGVALPELGSNKTLYVNTQQANISVWDTESNGYIVVGEKVRSITSDDIDLLFTTI